MEKHSVVRRNESFDVLAADLYELTDEFSPTALVQIAKLMDRAWRIGLMDAELYQEWIAGLHQGPPFQARAPFVELLSRRA